MDYTERLIFNKLLGGSFRIGVSSKTLINALTKFSGQEASTLMHSLMGKWQPDEVSFKELISAENINPDNSKPYPFCLAYPLEKDLEDLGNLKTGSSNINGTEFADKSSKEMMKFLFGLVVKNW